MAAVVLLHCSFVYDNMLYNSRGRNGFRQVFFKEGECENLRAKFGLSEYPPTRPHSRIPVESSPLPLTPGTAKDS